MVCGLAPSRHQKLLVHIRRSMERQRKRKTAGDLADSEEEEEEEVGMGGGRLVSAGSWIKEAGGDEPLDLLDSSLMASRISSQWCEWCVSLMSNLACLLHSHPPSTPEASSTSCC